MKTFFWSIGIYGLAMLIHIIVWKIRLPKRQTKTLLSILFLTLGSSLIILFSAPAGSSLALYAPRTLPEFLHIALFFVSLTLAYMITYSAIEADSPSLVMIMRIAKDGVQKEEFERSMTDEVLVAPRVRDLLTDKMAYLDGNRYRLTSKGVFMTRLFLAYRGLMRLGKGG